MNYLNKLANLLDAYVEEDRKNRDLHNRNIALKALYEELLKKLEVGYIKLKDDKLFVSLLLSSIFSDNFYLDEFYKILMYPDDSSDKETKFNVFVNNIYHDYKVLLDEIETLKFQIENNKHRVSSANCVKLCLKQGIPINQSRYDVNNVKNIIAYFEIKGVITNKEEVLIINEIDLYNRRMATKKIKGTEDEYFDRLYSEIPNILNAGFYSYYDSTDDEIEINDRRKNSLDNYVQTIYEIISVAKNDEIVNEIMKYHDYYKLDDNEYKYIMIKLLDRFFCELRTYYLMLTDEALYRKNDDRKAIVTAYYEVLERYLVLFGYYNKYNQMLTIDDVDIEDVNEEFFSDKTNELVYSHFNLDVTKAKIFKDMENIPFEYYDRVYRLLNDFKNNTISSKEVKKLKISKKHNYYELKDDQVRIVMKHMGDNVFAILGLFAKKNDNDPAKYNTIVKRNLPDISTPSKKQIEFELAKKYEVELADLVNTKGRKGNR